MIVTKQLKQLISAKLQRIGVTNPNKKPKKHRFSKNLQAQQEQ